MSSCCALMLCPHVVPSCCALMLCPHAGTLCLHNGKLCLHTVPVKFDTNHTPLCLSIVHCSTVMITIVHWVIYSTMWLLHSPVPRCTSQLFQSTWGEPGICLKKWPKFAELTGNASHLLSLGGRLGMKQVVTSMLHCVAVMAEQYLTTTLLMHTSFT